MTPYIVRVGGSEQRPLLNFLQAKCFLKPDRMDTRFGYWWITYIAQQAVAFAAMTEEVAAGRAILERGGVLEAFRGHDLQTGLIEARLEFARALGLKEAVTHTLSDNAASINSLIKCGFRRYIPVREKSRKWAHWRREL